jgi:hypothetical protein
MLSRRSSRNGSAADLKKPPPHPALSDLRAAQRDLREERLEDAWVDLENATLALRSDPAPRPLVAKAMSILERARDRLSRADVAAAAAAIASAAAALSAL